MRWCLFDLFFHDAGTIKIVTHMYKNSVCIKDEFALVMGLALIFYHVLIYLSRIFIALLFTFSVIFLSHEGIFLYLSALFSQTQEEKRLHFPVHSVSPEE